MAVIIEKEYEIPGVSPRTEMHETDLIQELGRRLSSLYRYDRDIASADERPELLEFWRCAKSPEQTKIDQLKQFINQQDHGHGV